MLVSTKDMLVKAQKEHYAVANFCIWNVEMLSGVMKACEKLQSPRPSFRVKLTSSNTIWSVYPKHTRSNSMS